MLTVVLAAVAAGVVVGSSGAVSKATVTCGDTITSPGVYFLTADCSAGPIGIQIASNNVTLQLMGHEITGPVEGISVLSSSHVLIKGPGTILAYSEGIGVVVSDSSDVRVDGLTAGFSQIGIDVAESTNVAVTHNSTFFTLVGVFLTDASGNTVESNKVAASSAWGIVAVFGSSYNNIVDNTVSSNTSGIGLDTGATGNRVFANNARGNSVVDLFDANAACDSNQWRRNGFNTANQSCIH
jgi:parallel beta-helix repeat protein